MTLRLWSTVGLWAIPRDVLQMNRRLARVLDELSELFWLENY